MTLQEVTVKEFNSRVPAGDFDAIVSEFIVGNSPSRPYTFWHSTSKQNVFGYKNPQVDEALEGIRRASNDIEYKVAFRSFQTSIAADPPGVFLALGEISRAVSRRFRVISPAGSDILSTIADWEVAESPEVTN
jgi:ABC-type oligopeptide transport system substrate-binding subunit